MTVYLDSNIFIYLILNDPKRAERCGRLLKDIQKKRIPAVTSVLTLCEVHYIISKYISKEAALKAIQAILAMEIEFVDLDLSAFASGMLKAQEHSLKISDSVHLATALMRAASKIYSYDADFDRTELKRVEP